MTSSPSHSLADQLFHQATDLLACGDAAAAADIFRNTLVADPEHIESHHGLIRALGDSGQLEEAISAAKSLTALTPDDPLAHTSLSIALQRAGYNPEAEAAAGRARILEWKQQLASGPNESASGE